VLLAVLIGMFASCWSWADAQARAVVVISSALDAPVLTPAIGAMSGEPRLSDARVAGNPSLVAKPAGKGPWPAIFVVNGTVPEGRKLPAVRHLAEGFARAGYLAVVPDLPGLTEDRITPQTADAATQAAFGISGRAPKTGRSRSPGSRPAQPWPCLPPRTPNSTGGSRSSLVSHPSRT
jgi:hypothetical protein